MEKTLRTILAALLIIVAGYFTVQLVGQAQERKQLVSQNAELNSVKYGLFSVHAWKDQVAEILGKKIEQFELTPENRGQIQGSIQNALYELLDQFDQILREKRNEGGLIGGFFAGLFQSLVFDVDDLRKRVPEFTNIVMTELEKKENRENLKAFIKGKLTEMLEATAGKQDLSAIAAVSKAHACSSLADCRTLIANKMTECDQLMQRNLQKVGLLALLIFLVLILGNARPVPIHGYLLVGLCGMLLISGVLTPMIEIDARIQDFEVMLMGEPLSFQNQVIFFQSKSIFEVVRILVATKSVQSIFVGLLILLFSIAFPFAKMFSTIAALRNPEVLKNRFVNFMAIKSGKWSLADVLVVAIFMSYIGFTGVIQSQLGQLEQISSHLQILTTDQSVLGIGFSLFLGFCVASMLLSAWLGRRFNREELEDEGIWEHGVREKEQDFQL